MPTGARIQTCLWFEDRAEEAAAFYVSLFDGSEITHVARGANGAPMLVSFHLQGAPYAALNGGPHYELTPAASISVLCDDQPEIDRLWDALTAEGGVPGRCGWLVDRFGLSWQIAPRSLAALLQGPRAADVSAALMQMSKLDLSTLEAAGAEASNAP